MVRAAALAVALALIAAGPAPAAPVLGGETDVAAQGPAYADVRLPREVNLSLDEGEIPSAVFRGDGLVQIAHLTCIACEREGLIDLTFELHRYGPPEDPDEGWLMKANTERPDVDVDSLPAGTYRLQLLSERPVAGTLRLPGVPGTATVRPVAPAAFEGGALERLYYPQTTTAFGGSGTGHGEIRLAAGYYDDATGVKRLEFCVYEGSAWDHTERPYSAGCPGGESHGAATTLVTPNLKMSADWSGMPGTWGVGVNWTDLAQSAKAWGAGAWFGRIDAPAAPAITPPRAGTAVPVRRTLRVRGRRASLRLRCGGGPCSGLAALRGARARRFSIEDGARARLRLPVPRRAGPRARLVITQRTATGVAASVHRVRLARR